MQGQIETQRLLEAVAAALNDRGLDDFDTARVQWIVDEAVAGKQRLTVDNGGGLHDLSGARVGAIRRAPSGEWIIDGQNTDAARAHAEIPAAAKDQSVGNKDNEP